MSSVVPELGNAYSGFEISHKMIYRLYDMTYGMRRMIYLLCKCNMISVPTGTDTIEKLQTGARSFSYRFSAKKMLCFGMQTRTSII